MSSGRKHQRRKESAGTFRASPRVRCRSTAARSLLLLAMLIPLTSGLAGCRSGISQDTGLFAAMQDTRFSDLRAPWNRSKDRDALAEGRKFTAAGRREVEAARRQFDSENYAEAAKLYKKLARDYSETAVGEEAQFRLGECYFAQKQYPKAQDAYDQLFADYPSTRYVENVTERFLTIAKDWLDVSDPAHRSTIRTVSAEQVKLEPTSNQPRGSSDPTVKLRILPNFHDKTRPVFDTQGRALQALKSIWLNDPTGPLADDALMMTASYYLRRKDFVESDRYLTILREEYPESPHYRDSFLLGSHVRLMSYEGPYYDGAALDGAAQLTAQTINMFPDSEARPQLRQDLQKMYLLKAQRRWKQIEYYEAKGNDRAIGIACIQLIREFPDTKHADLARRRLAKIDRRELAGLPQIDQTLSSLNQPTTRQPTPTKSVSDSSGGTSGKVKL